MAPLPIYTISIGDPAGVGPEVTVKACRDTVLHALGRWVIVGEAWQVQELASQYDLQIDQIIHSIDELDESSGIAVLDAGLIKKEDVTTGQVSAACGHASINYVRIAAELCIADKCKAMVTGPISKEAVAASGIDDFCGHTEYITELCGLNTCRMMLWNETVCVIHVTTHCSLFDAVTRIDQQRILETIQIGNQAMLDLGFENPHLCICGLNPHAGENGMFGSEEIDLIIPAVKQAQSEGINVTGPYPADTLFMQAVRGKCDMVVAMYHDQGHVPMKLYDFEHTVNVTLGLPIVRCSVDHGTAFDIAGQGIADPVDMQTAMKLAVNLTT
ncbi:MAG: 4-hydroxythreonine-4-phosphate dehydrogenase PdxA [Planctomycetaceae bacterium]|nr:4-hydroxythreonine-4-phosphate dehydrogenase PdxA [Planctomycetaceae bacterium]|tara:strand:- start:1851 stop:2837 length:987 start_codon:yes stop_codon:yes gene_type:complete